MASEELGLVETYNSRRILFWLGVGWFITSADRMITGPAITWMIDHHVSFLGNHALYAQGGLIGSIFFAGYLLMQFPGGYIGDRHGHRTVIVVCLFAAAVATFISGLAGTLLAFVAARILTGLGEGIFYANDRAIISDTTPFRDRSFAMGVVMVGLSLGNTFGTLGGAWMVEMGRPLLGEDNAWRTPFLVLAIISLLVAFGMRRELWRTRTSIDRPAAALKSLARYWIVFFILIFAVFLLARQFGLPNWAVSALELLLALGLVGYIFRSKTQEVAGAIRDRNLWLLYISAIAILWNLWFLGFWAISIISSSAGSSFLKAALTAMFTGVAGLVGYPIGGWLADRMVPLGYGRKPLLLGLTLAQCVITFSFGFYIQEGGQSLVVLAGLLFAAGLFFSALMPVNNAITADIAAPSFRGSAFGMWNLVGEVGAVLSPVVSGTLRDLYGNWVPAIYLDAGLILMSFGCLLFLCETKSASHAVREEQVPVG